MIKIQATFPKDRNKLTLANATGLPNDFLRKVFGTDPFSVTQIENMFEYLNSKGVSVVLDGELPFVELKDDSVEIQALQVIPTIIKKNISAGHGPAADIEEVLREVNSFRQPYEKYMLTHLRAAFVILKTCLYVSLSNEDTHAKITKYGKVYLAGLGKSKQSIISEIDFSEKK